MLPSCTKALNSTGVSSISRSVTEEMKTRDTLSCIDGVLKVKKKQPPLVSSFGIDDGNAGGLLFCRIKTLPSSGWKRSVSRSRISLMVPFLRVRFHTPVQLLSSVPSGGPPQAASKINAPLLAPFVARSMHTSEPKGRSEGLIASVKQSCFGWLATGNPSKSITACTRPSGHV